MTHPISSGSSWNPYVSIEDDDEGRLVCEPSTADRLREPTLLDPGAPSGNAADYEDRGVAHGSQSCSAACGVATSVACATVGFGAALALSPTVVGAAAGAAIGLDCGLASTVLCEQVCKPPEEP